MGYIKHHTIVVTGWKKESVLEAHEKAIAIFDEAIPNAFGTIMGSQIVSPIISGLTNSQNSFFICPDGSKEGWDTSDEADVARKTFLDWLMGNPNNYCDYVEVIFGGDDEINEVIRSKDSDLIQE